MRNKTNYWMALICILGVLVGRILNRVLSSYFWNNGSTIVVAVSGAIALCVILIIIARGHYKSAIILFIMAIPIFIIGIGLYMDNINVVELGIISVFIIYPILIKVLPKLKRDRQE